MALGMKKEDGTLVDVSGGGGGTFDGEHVPTGDPTDPATLDIVDEGQLLWDGVESDGGSGAKFISETVVVPANPGVSYSSVEVTFPEPFDALPNITLTAQSGSAVYAEAANTTTTGFECIVRSTSALNRDAADVSDRAINRDYSVWYQATDDSTISRFGGGSGGGSEPHDHAEYAPVEHDHDDYMPHGSIETQYFKSDQAAVDVVGASQGDPTYVVPSYLHFASKPYDRTIHVDGSCPVNWVSGGTVAGRQVYVAIGYRVASPDGFDTNTYPWAVGTPMGLDPAPLVAARTFQSVTVGRSVFVPAGERADFRIYAWRNGSSENQAGGTSMWIRAVAYPGGGASTFDMADDTAPSWYLEDGTPMYGTSEIVEGA
jgi:hypothetical protein